MVIGNAIHRENPEALAVMEREIPYLSFPQAVRRFLLDGRHPVVVAGTHGKTTTTAAIASILESCGLAPGFLVGGVLNGLQRSYGIGTGAPFAVEGDEYETAFFDKVPKFLHYAPKTLVLTGVEFDHADNFSSLAHLRSVFLNLVALLPPDGCLIYNAAESKAEGAHVRITTRRLEDTIEITIADDGDGIDMNARERIFDPFYTSRLVEGRSGLGLSVVHGIVGDHGGKLEVEDVPDGGTQIRVQLPLSRLESEAASSPVTSE